MSESTKRCTRCGSERLVLYWSTNEKQCGQCLHVMPWLLEEGQPPLLGPARKIRHANHRSNDQ